MTSNEFIANEINKIWIERLERWIKMLRNRESSFVINEMTKSLEEFKL